MIKIYLKQAWSIIRQKRLFSSIYIIGTAMAIAITMTLFVIYYVKTGPIYPEYNRGRTAVVKLLNVTIFQKREGKEEPVRVASFRAGINRNIIPDILEKNDNIDVCTATSTYTATKITADNGKQLQKKLLMRYTDVDFWQVFTFDFLSGRKFEEGDMTEKPQTAIITLRLAKELFASAQVIGREIEIGSRKYSIVGVVKSPSSAAMDSYAEVFVPSSLLNNPKMDQPFSVSSAHGSYDIYFTVKDRKHIKETLEQIQNTIKRLNVEAADTFESASVGDMFAQIDEFNLNPHWKSQLVNDSAGESIMEIVQRLMLLVFSLLIVPAINLSSMISSQMEERKAEIGVRMAFGATKGAVMKQVLWENMLLTTIGGIIGLLLTWLIVYTGAEWVLTIFDMGEILSLAEKELNTDMLMNPYIFITTFLVCLIINMASAWLPARWALKHTIADSLNSKK